MPAMNRMRARQVGIPCGKIAPGPHNAITDVVGVRVGHYTLTDCETRTGVTAILPHGGNIFREKVVATAYVVNGFGKAIGLSQINELGQLETPILLTSTLAAPKAADALISWMVARDADITSINPVVGECNDSFLNDIQKRALQPEHVWHALDSASDGPVAEGAVGGGAGMTAFGYKGGIGTASRKLPDELGGYTVGMLVMANFGAQADLLIAGIPVGQELIAQADETDLGDGSIMMVLAVDAPLSSRQLGRLARRVPFGLARTGSVASHGSGDFVLAFSAAERMNAEATDGLERHVKRIAEDGKLLTTLFGAVVEATEEAIYNALCMAETTVGYQGHQREALPLDAVRSILQKYHRLSDS